MLLNLSPMPMPWFLAMMLGLSFGLSACSLASTSDNQAEVSKQNNQPASLRVIYYPHSAIEKNKLISELKKHCLKNDDIKYVRKMSTLGHVLILRSQNQTTLKNLFKTIKQQPTTRVLEADSIIKIQ